MQQKLSKSTFNCYIYIFNEIELYDLNHVIFLLKKII